MKRTGRIRAPQLTNQKTTFGKVAWRDPEFTAQNSTLGNKKALARRIRLESQRHPSRRLRGTRQEEALTQQHIWRDFYQAGLPVPRFSKIDFRNTSKNYLTIFTEDMQKRFGKLLPTHVKGLLKFPRKLTFAKDRELIAGMAKDLSTIHSIGYNADFFTLWRVYKKGDTFGRVIVDFSPFQKVNFDGNQYGIMLDSMERVLGKKEIAYFIKIYQQSSTARENATIRPDYLRFRRLINQINAPTQPKP